MLFNSLQFLIFFPIICIFYYLIPHRIRYLYLLICSYFFYGCWNPKYVLLMFTSTVITYLSGLLIDTTNKNISDKRKCVQLKRTFVFLSFFSNLCILFFFKYYNFAANTIIRFFQYLGISLTIPAFDVILPVGISFYTFQALSYTVDVYRGDIYAEPNFFKYALFVSFFPQLVAGPIERSKNLLIQISQKHPFDYDRMRYGLLRMLYGYFQKVVLADHLSIIVDSVYNNYNDCTGFQIMVATIIFAFQIYCDFASYSNIAIGAAQIMGFKLMDNFDTPYLSRSVAEFWRRWHISLSSWFKDYLYIPLGGSRKGKMRKYINIMIVFLVSGLWHGASWHFVVWGGLNGLFQIIGDILKPINNKVCTLMQVDKQSGAHILFQTILTFVLVDITWIFFRANSFMQGFDILKSMLNMSSGSWFTWGHNLERFGITASELNVIIVSFIFLLVVDIFRYKKIDMISMILRQRIWIRFPIYYFALFFILIFGAYGPMFDAAQFIYFQF